MRPPERANGLTSSILRGRNYEAVITPSRLGGSRRDAPKYKSAYRARARRVTPGASEIYAIEADHVTKGAGGEGEVGGTDQHAAVRLHGCCFPYAPRTSL